MNLEGFQLFQITTLQGFSEAFSYLICMMNQARLATLQSVQNLSILELDVQLDDNANSIGSLLAHIVAVEKWYQSYTFDQKEPAGDELTSMEAALDLGEKGRRSQIRGHELNYYLDQLQAVRNRTIEEFRKRNDDWLMQQMPFTTNATANNFYMWYHVFEDETNHRGQINFIRKRIKRSY
jgi:uncharacterized damage-inducible protein DinB